jgi:hypothetical protein
MSSSLSSPWIYSNIHKILSSLGNEKCKNPSKIVQVINTCDELNSIVINDKENLIHIYLTSDCIHDLSKSENFINNTGEFKLSLLKDSLIKLEKYHYSTYIQCCGNRDLTKIKSTPLAILCHKIGFINSVDCSTIGEPMDINFDPRFTIILITNHYEINFRQNYKELVNLLAKKQFPKEKFLPDCNNKFQISSMGISDSNPLLFYECIPSDDQLAIHNRLDKIPNNYNHTDIIKFLQSYKESTNNDLNNHSPYEIVANNENKLIRSEVSPIRKSRIYEQFYDYEDAQLNTQVPTQDEIYESQFFDCVS